MSQGKTIGIIVFDDVLTAEVVGPAEVFAIASEREWFAGSQVLLIGIEDQATIRTQEGLTLTVDHTIADDLSLDVLIVPGAYDVSALLENEALNAFIRQQEQSVEWVSSLCAGAFLLGNAGVLDGKQATTWFGGESSLQEQFPQIQVAHDTPVVVDQRRITANGGLVSYRAALILLAQLVALDHVREVYDSLGIGRIGDWQAITATVAQQA